MLHRAAKPGLHSGEGVRQICRFRGAARFDQNTFHACKNLQSVLFFGVMGSRESITLGLVRAANTGGPFCFAWQAVHLAARDELPLANVLDVLPAVLEPVADGSCKTVGAGVAQPPGAHGSRAAGQQVAGFGVPDRIPKGIVDKVRHGGYPTFRLPLTVFWGSLWTFLPAFSSASCTAKLMRIRARAARMSTMAVVNSPSVIVPPTCAVPSMPRAYSRPAPKLPAASTCQTVDLIFIVVLLFQRADRVVEQSRRPAHLPLKIVREIALQNLGDCAHQKMQHAAGTTFDLDGRVLTVDVKFCLHVHAPFSNFGKKYSPICSCGM
nr:MAG TPA: hypothetical protein [Caudoviricetes sp.]